LGCGDYTPSGFGPSWSARRRASFRSALRVFGVGGVSLSLKRDPLTLGRARAGGANAPSRPRQRGSRARGGRFSRGCVSGAPSPLRRVAGGTFATTISCGKSEFRLGCAHDNPALFHSKTAGRRFPRLSRDDLNGRIFVAPFTPRNPLKSLDSDERIQGNPRQPQPVIRAPSRRNGQEPRKSKRIDRMSAAAPR